MGLAPFILLHEVWGLIVHLKVNEPNKAWCWAFFCNLKKSLPASHHILYFCNGLFSQTLHKIFEKLCHFIYSICYHHHRLAVFKSYKNMSGFFKKDKSIDLLTWKSEPWSNVRLNCGGTCSFSPLSSELPLFLCFWSHLELMDVRCFFCASFIFCHFVGGRWSGRITWCWGFCFKHCKWHFHHVNLKYAVQLHWFLSTNAAVWPRMHISSWIVSASHVL